MSSIDSMAQLYLDQYNLETSNSLQSNGSQSSGMDSALADIIADNSTSGSGVSLGDILAQTEAAYSIDQANEQLQSNQTNALVQFYNDASSLNQAASQLVTPSDSDKSNNISAANINDFVTAYNDLVSLANDNSQYINSSALAPITQSFENEAQNLQSIGITQNSDGTLSVDQDTLNNALENNRDTVESAFASVDGLASNAASATQNILTNSLSQYATQLTPESTNSTSFYNLVGELNTSDLWNSFLGQVLNTNG